VVVKVNVVDANRFHCGKCSIHSLEHYRLLYEHSQEWGLEELEECFERVCDNIMD